MRVSLALKPTLLGVLGSALAGAHPYGLLVVEEELSELLILPSPLREGCSTCKAFFLKMH